MNVKSIFSSKTFWVNLIMAGLVMLNQQIPTFNLGADEQAIIVGAVNILLRFLTTQSVAVLPPK
jgi:uncharacterized membrane protein